MAQRPMGETPMEYMVDFFGGIFDIMASIVEKAVTKAYQESQKRHRDYMENVRGQTIPHCIADEMAYENTDISRKMAFNWTRKDREKYLEAFNILPEEIKQKRRDAFEKKALTKIAHQLKVYEADTGEAFDNPGAYCIYDRQHQPIYQKRLKKSLKNQNDYATVNMTQNQDPKKEVEQHQKLNKQSSKQRQKDEIKNNELDGKKGVEIELQEIKEVKIGEKVSNATNEVKDGKYTNLEIETGHKNIQYNKNSSASNEVENKKYTKLAQENVKREEFKAKVEKGAEDRKKKATQNFQIQKLQNDKEANKSSIL